MPLSKLKENSEKTVASVDIRDAQQAGLTEKIISDLDNPRCKAAQNVQEAVFKAWGVHIKVENDKLIMEAAKQAQGR